MSFTFEIKDGVIVVPTQESEPVTIPEQPKPKKSKKTKKDNSANEDTNNSLFDVVE